MADYRYHFCDALTGVRLEELPVDCRSFDQKINGAGSLTGTITLGDKPFRDPTTGQQLLNWRTVVSLKRTLVIVQRNDQYLWGGWVTKLRPVNGGTAVEIGADTLEGWLAEQEIQADLAFTNTDVFTIVRGIIAHVAGQAGGNMRIDTGSNVAGYTDTVTYLGKDSAKALDAINKLAEASPGFEYSITWGRSGNVFTPVMTLATPGLATTVDPIVLEHPGIISDYDAPETAAPNVMTGVGADTGGGVPLLARVEDTAGELAAGVPRLPGQIQAKDETDLTRLTARTQSALNAGLADYAIPTVVLRPPQSPTDLHVGDLTFGMPVRLRITSPYHPAGIGGRPGLGVTRRITGWSVVPKADEQATLTLGSTTGKILTPVGQRSVADYLRDLDRRVREIATRT